MTRAVGITSNGGCADEDVESSFSHIPQTDAHAEDLTLQTLDMEIAGVETADNPDALTGEQASPAHSGSSAVRLSHAPHCSVNIDVLVDDKLVMVPFYAEILNEDPCSISPSTTGAVEPREMGSYGGLEQQAKGNTSPAVEASSTSDSDDYPSLAEQLPQVRSCPPQPQQPCFLLHA